MASTKLELFWAKTLAPREDGCILWVGAKSVEGYGRFKGDAAMEGAHRWIYKQLRGPIPDGLHLDHLCRTRACVNVEHLEPVTPRENLMRGLSPSAILARKTHCIRGHEFTKSNTYHAPNGSRVCRQCAVAYQRRLRSNRRERGFEGELRKLSDPVDRLEFSRRTGFRPATIAKWRSLYDTFPKPAVFAGHRGFVWEWSAVAGWMKANRRETYAASDDTQRRDAAERLEKWRAQ